MEELKGDGTDLSIEKSLDADGDPRLTLRGELDLSTVEAFRTVVEEIIDSGSKHLVLELEELTFMDSSGISVMVLATKHIDEVELHHASEIIRRVIEVTGLAEVLRVDPS
jgi:anti-anti-sigma factor